MEPWHPTERRAAARHPARSMARLTLLREFGESPEALVLVEEYSEGGARLRVPFALVPGDPVRLDWADELLLGEVIHSYADAQQQGAATWVCGIRFEQGIFGLDALKRLLSEIYQEDESAGAHRRL